MALRNPAYAKCVSQLTGKNNITPEEAEIIINNIDNVRQRFAPNIDAEEIMPSVIGMFEEQSYRRMLLKRNVILNRIKISDSLNTVNERMKSGLTAYEALESLLVGDLKRAFGGRMYVDLKREAINLEHWQGLVDDFGRISEAQGFSADHIGKILIDRNDPQRIDFANELYGIDTKNSLMKEAAEAYRNRLETLRLMEHKAGILDKHIENYTPHSNSMDKISSTNATEWMADIYDAIDWSKTMTDVAASERMAKLREIYETISVNGDHEFYDGDFINNTARIIHFKDGASWLKYQDKYGVGNLMELTDQHIGASARRIALAETFGPNFDDNFAELVTMVKRQVAAEELKTTPGTKEHTRLQEISKQINREWGDGPTGTRRSGALARQWTTVTGRDNNPASPNMAKFFANARSYSAITNLGLAVLSALNDSMVMVAHLRAIGRGGNFIQRLYNVFSGKVKGYESRGREIVREMGFFNTSRLAWLFNKLDFANNSKTMSMTKIADKFMRFNFLTGLTDVDKGSYAFLLSREIGGMRDIPFNKLNARTREWMKTYGIDEPKWNLYRKMTEPVDDWHMLSPEMAYRLPNEDFVHLISPELRSSTVSKEFLDMGFDASSYEVTRNNALKSARQKTRQEMVMWFRDDYKYAVMEPDARLKSFMTQGLQRGTLAREVLSTTSQFLSFPTSFVFRQLRGKGWKAYDKTGFDGAGLISFMSSLIAMGYLVGATKDIVSGRTPKEVDNWNTWMSALAQSGFLGVYSDFLFNATNMSSGNPATKFLGGSVGSMIGPLFRVPYQLLSGDPKGAGKTVANTVVGNVPGANTFFLKAAADYLIFNDLKEKIDPGFNSKMRRRIKRDFNQTYLIPTR